MLKKIQLSPNMCVIQNHIVFQSFGDEITSKRCLAFFVSCISNTNSRSIVFCFFLSFRLAFDLSAYPNHTSECSKKCHIRSFSQLFNVKVSLFNTERVLKQYFLQIHASPGYPSFSSNLIRNLEPFTCKNKEV